MRLAGLLLLAALSMGQPSQAQRNFKLNPALDPFKILLGKWTEGEATVDFYYDVGGQVVIGRARTSPSPGPPRELIVIYSEGAENQVRADSFDVDRQVIHYRLESSDANNIHLVSDASGRHLIYQKLDFNHLLYRFQTSPPGQPNALTTTAKGMLTRAAGLVRPLSE